MAAAATSSFWLDAGTNAAPEPCSKIVVPSSSTTRQPDRPPIACCRAAVRVRGTGGGAGLAGDDGPGRGGGDGRPRQGRRGGRRAGRRLGRRGRSLGDRGRRGRRRDHHLPHRGRSRAPASPPPERLTTAASAVATTTVTSAATRPCFPRQRAALVSDALVPTGSMGLTVWHGRTRRGDPRPVSYCAPCVLSGSPEP